MFLDQLDTRPAPSYQIATNKYQTFQESGYLDQLGLRTSTYSQIFALVQKVLLADPDQWLYTRLLWVISFWRKNLAVLQLLSYLSLYRQRVQTISPGTDLYIKPTTETRPYLI